MCPHCGSLERHRLFKLWLDANRERIVGKRVLHFAPGAAVSDLVRPLAGSYATADIAPGCAALAEMHRILVIRGIALLMTPIVEGWATTYENSPETKPNDRTIHFARKIKLDGLDRISRPCPARGTLT